MNHAFESFWNVWPKSPRKGSKAACLAKWEKMKLDFQATHIIKHVTWLKTTETWLKGGGVFIPAPLVYLNQQRWDGAEVPDVVEAKPHYVAVKGLGAEDAVPMPDSLRQRLAQMKKSLQT